LSVFDRRPAVLRRFGVVAVAAAAILLGTASAAAAHAALLSTSPSQSAHYPAGASPAKVSVTFDDDVTTTPKSVAVYDGKGHAMTVTPVHTGNEKIVEARLPKLGDGTYAVVWHIVSDDGHPETGAFTFSVGAAGASTADIRSLVASRSSGTGIGLAFGIVRGIEFFTCLVLVGGLAFARWRWPSVLGRRDVRGLLLVVAALGVLSTLASIPLEAAYSLGGGASTLVSGTALRDVVDARFGNAALVRAALLLPVSMYVFVRARAGRRAERIAVEVPLGLLGLMVTATFAYAGHGFTGRWPTFGLLMDVTHLSAASLWLGGLVLLAWVLRKRTDAAAAATALTRFSRLALPAVAVIVISGSLQGWRQVGTWSGLWHTSYGRLLIIKVLVVLAIVVIASAGREVLRERPTGGADGGGSSAGRGPGPGPGADWVLPGVSGGGSTVAVDAPATTVVDLTEQHTGGWSPGWSTDDDRSAVREVRRGVGLEVGLAVVVLGVTSALVVTPPSREVEAAAKTPEAQTAHVNALGRTVGYDVATQPTLAGDNTIVVTPHLVGRTGFLPTSLTGSVQAAGSSLRTRLTFTPLANGQWVAVASLPRAGTWTVRLTGVTPPTTDTAALQITVR
jgi:copper transport protein